MPGIKVTQEGLSENEEAESESGRSTVVNNSSSSDSESDDSSEIDEEECDRRRNIYTQDISELENQFSQMREQLYHERLKQVLYKLEEVREETAIEYVLPLKELTETLKIRLEVSSVLREFKLQNAHSKHEAEIFAAKQNYQNEVDMLRDSIEAELEEKIGRLEEDRNSVDVTSQMWAEQNLKNKYKKQLPGNTLTCENRKRKPTSVSGPYIVYMLKESDILDDWAIIKKALTASKRKNKFARYSSSPRHLTEFHAS